VEFEEAEVVEEGDEISAELPAACDGCWTRIVVVEHAAVVDGVGVAAKDDAELTQIARPPSLPEIS